jgi:hypothetical protein
MLGADGVADGFADHAPDINLWRYRQQSQTSGSIRSSRTCYRATTGGTAELGTDGAYSPSNVSPDEPPYWACLTESLLSGMLTI